MITNMLKTIDGFAETQPNFLVYDCLGDQYTYKDLKENSDAIAQFIDDLSIEEKSPVIVFGAQTYEMLATFIGLSKAGHAYIPVDSHTAINRILSIYSISQPSLVIAIEDLPVTIEGACVISRETIIKHMKKKITYELTHSVLGDENYYIIFTSGTTGAPKGVQISHDNLLSFTNWMITDKSFKMMKQPQMLAQPPYSFDLSVMYWAPTLALGGTLFALPRYIISDFSVLFKTIMTLPIVIWTSTPSFVELAMLHDDFRQEQMPQLTHFYFDGEELTVSTAKKLFERFPDAHIVNAYGPTEATVALSAIQITKEMLEMYKRLPIGYPKSDSPTFVIDDNGQPVETGVQGEIIVTGPAVSKGYLNNPEKTKGAFFTFNGVSAYRTGDLGSFSDNNILLYRGRRDFQIKYGGFRIELEDVSQQLNKSPLIASAVAIPRYNKAHKVQNLLAYVVLKDNVYSQYNREIDVTKAIKASLKGIIMPYMMPTKFIYKEHLPLTPNGKIDIKLLINEVNR